MAKPETLFRKKISKHFKPKFTVMAIESGDTAPGVPDTHLLLNGTNKTCWLELKHEKTPPKTIKLRKSQVVWNRRYARNGGRSWIVLKVDDPNQIFIWTGSLAKEIKDGDFDIYYQPYATFYPGKKGEWKLFMDHIEKEIVKFSR